MLKKQENLLLYAGKQGMDQWGPLVGSDPEVHLRYATALLRERNEMHRMLVVTLACLLSLTGLANAKEHQGAKPSPDQAAEMTQEGSKSVNGQGRDDADSDSGAGRPADGDSDSAGASKRKSDVDSDSGGGNEQSAEMRERRDERKQIQEEYRSGSEPGQEGDKAAGEGGKKPWWKFWEN